MKKILCAFCLTVSALGLTACGIGDTNTTYQRYEIGQQGVISTGQIIAINHIQTAGQNDIGSLGGAIAGGADSYSPSIVLLLTIVYFNPLLIITSFN